MEFITGITICTAVEETIAKTLLKEDLKGGREAEGV